jgi:hypothetical protein
MVERGVGVAVRWDARERDGFAIIVSTRRSQLGVAPSNGADCCCDQEHAFRLDLGSEHCVRRLYAATEGTGEGRGVAGAFTSAVSMFEEGSETAGNWFPR